MWNYDRKLQYPVKIARPDAAAAKIILTQFGGPDGELGASQRYLAQRCTAPYNEVKAVLTDIGTEELAHTEMICVLFTSSLGISARKRSNGRDLIPTLSNILRDFIQCPPREFLFPPEPSSPKAMSSPI